MGITKSFLFLNLTLILCLLKEILIVEALLCINTCYEDCSGSCDKVCGLDNTGQRDSFNVRTQGYIVESCLPNDSCLFLEFLGRIDDSISRDLVSTPYGCTSNYVFDQVNFGYMDKSSIALFACNTDLCNSEPSKYPCSLKAANDSCTTNKQDEKFRLENLIRNGAVDEINLSQKCILTEDRSIFAQLDPHSVCFSGNQISCLTTAPDEINFTSCSACLPDPSCVVLPTSTEAPTSTPPKFESRLTSIALGSTIVMLLVLLALSLFLKRKKSTKTENKKITATESPLTTNHAIIAFPLAASIDELVSPLQDDDLIVKAETVSIEELSPTNFEAMI